LRHVARTCVRAGWIPDFQSRYLPEFYTSKQLSAVNRSCNTIVRQTSVVILSSRTAELDFQKFYPLHVDKIKVLPFRTYSLDAWYEPDPEQIQYKYSLPDRFLIVSNQFWQHKNHLLVFRALKILQDQSVYPIVVCTGNLYDHRQPNYSNVILQAIDELNLNNQVHLLGLIHRLDQIQLMRRALAVIQPSLFEGWSTVVEDSRCLGKEILLSDIAVHLEQNPPNGQFFEQNSPEDLACLMKQCWETLTPGPNLAHEEVAKELNKTEVQDFGYRFLEIVKDSLLV
jgi:glycosyltransferase involved in cell wall biosynthesis